MKLILVDASYNSFYRFFATLRWYQFAEKDDYKNNIKGNPNYDFFENKKFMDKYKKMYLSGIEKFIPQMDEEAILFFCLDVKQSTLWRHKLIKDSEVKEKDEYKGERPDLSSKYNLDSIFNYTYQKMLQEFKKEKDYPIEILKFTKTEADDIIAIISQELEKENEELEIIIVSGDDDFTQLLRDNVSILDFRTKKFKVKSKEDSQEKLRIKIINGDKSDNIRSIFPKSRKDVSLKQRKQVRESIEEMQTFLEENEDAKKRFELNEKLIDFRLIPDNIREPVVKKLQKLTKKYDLI